MKMIRREAHLFDCLVSFFFELYISVRTGCKKKEKRKRLKDTCVFLSSPFLATTIICIYFLFIYFFLREDHE